MSVQHPVTLSEWEAYINGLSGKVLREAAMAANSVDFVRQLESEKIDHGVIGSIFSMFAQRLREDDQIVPRGYVDYNTMVTPLKALDAPSED